MFTSHGGSMHLLQRQLESLDTSVYDRVNKFGGFELADLIDAVAHPKNHDIFCPEPIDDADVIDASLHAESMSLLGKNALADGKVGVVALTDAVTCPRWKFVNGNTPFTERGVLHGFESLRLSADNLLIGGVTQPSFHPCGTGDVIPALVNSGELSRFLTDGGRYIVVTTSDVPHYMIGHHITSGAPVTCGVKRRTVDSDTVVCNCDGFNQLVKVHRITSEISDDISLSWSGIIIIDALLDFRNVNWKWHRRKKTLGTHVVIEYERYIDDITSHFRTQFVHAK